MLTARELVYALAGVWRLAHFDANGFSYFDASVRGIWRSFWAALLLAPAWAFLVLGDGMGPAPARFVAAQLIGYVMGWLAYTLVAAKIADAFDRAALYPGYMTAYNWFQLVQGVLWVPVTLVIQSGLLSPLAAGLLWLACYAVLLVYNWFIARRGLDVSIPTAMGIVFVDALLGLTVGGVADALARVAD